MLNIIFVIYLYSLPVFVAFHVKNHTNLTRFVSDIRGTYLGMSERKLRHVYVLPSFKITAFGKAGGWSPCLCTVSEMTPTDPLQKPFSVHRFLVSITLTARAKNNFGSRLPCHQKQVLMLLNYYVFHLLEK